MSHNTLIVPLLTGKMTKTANISCDLNLRIVKHKKASCLKTRKKFISAMNRRSLSPIREAYIDPTLPLTPPLTPPLSPQRNAANEQTTEDSLRNEMDFLSGKIDTLRLENGQSVVLVQDHDDDSKDDDDEDDVDLSCFCDAIKHIDCICQVDM